MIGVENLQYPADLDVIALNLKFSLLKSQGFFQSKGMDGFLLFF